ncbi:MAG: hypothetical protein WCJ69_03465 [Betaproteobacteria bacterium]|jgi:hypothetical protein
MKRTAIALLCCLPVLTPAANYPLGTMTCEDIGTFSSEVMAAKKAGRTEQEALAALETRSYGDPVEKRTLADVVGVLYSNLGRNLGVKSAAAVMRTDCETGRTAR